MRMRKLLGSATIRVPLSTKNLIQSKILLDKGRKTVQLTGRIFCLQKETLQHNLMFDHLYLYVSVSIYVSIDRIDSNV